MKIFRALFFTLLIVVFAAPALEAKKPKKPEGEAADAGAAAPAAAGSSASHEGVEAAKAGDWNKAIEAFKRAGDDANNRYNLALAYRQRGLAETKQQNWDAAIADFNEALKLKRGRYHRASLSCRCLHEQTGLAESARRLRRGLESEAPYGGARAQLVEMQLKQYDKSIADYTEAIRQTEERRRTPRPQLRLRATAQDRAGSG